MAQPSIIPQQLMTGALLHFESGVPICDVDMRTEHKNRLARVDHVYWLWKKNPLLNTFELFKQLCRQSERGYANPQSLWRAAQKDQILFEFVRDNVSPPSRRQDEAVVRHAANHMIEIGLQTDNITALDKGSKRLYEVAGLDKPESDRQDMSKMMFIPPVITTSAHEVDDTKEDYTDQQALAIMNKYGAHIDEKRKAVEERVDAMLARREAEKPCHE